MDRPFYIQGVDFEVAEAMQILKKAQTYSLEQILANVPISCRETVKNIYETVEPITAEACLGLWNVEQRRVAISMFGFSELLQHFEHQVIDKQTIIKTHQRWSVSETGELEPYLYTFEDTYELIELKYTEQSFDRRTRQTNTFLLRGVRCQCTTTQREYFIFIPPKNIPTRNRFRREREPIIYTDDAIEAICQTFRVCVKPEAVKVFRRQGDVILTVIHPDFKNNWKCEERTITPQEYREKLEVET